jgi:hypothetical protein
VPGLFPGWGAEVKERVVTYLLLICAFMAYYNKNFYLFFINYIPVSSEKIP